MPPSPRRPSRAFSLSFGQASLARRAGEDVDHVSERGEPDDEDARHSQGGLPFSTLPSEAFAAPEPGSDLPSGPRAACSRRREACHDSRSPADSSPARTRLKRDAARALPRHAQLRVLVRRRGDMRSRRNLGGPRSTGQSAPLARSRRAPAERIGRPARGPLLRVELTDSRAFAACDDLDFLLPAHYPCLRHADCDPRENAAHALALTLRPRASTCSLSRSPDNAREDPLGARSRPSSEREALKKQRPAEDSLQRAVAEQSPTNRHLSWSGKPLVPV